MWIPSLRSCYTAVIVYSVLNVSSLVAVHSALGVVMDSAVKDPQLEEALFLASLNLGAVEVLACLTYFVILSSRFIRIMNLYLQALNEGTLSGGTNESSAPGESSVRAVILHVRSMPGARGAC